MHHRVCMYMHKRHIKETYNHEKRPIKETNSLFTTLEQQSIHMYACNRHITSILTHSLSPHSYTALITAAKNDGSTQSVALAESLFYQLAPEARNGRMYVFFLFSAVTHISTLCQPTIIGTRWITLLPSHTRIAQRPWVGLIFFLFAFNFFAFFPPTTEIGTQWQPTVSVPDWVVLLAESLVVPCLWPSHVYWHLTSNCPIAACEMMFFSFFALFSPLRSRWVWHDSFISVTWFIHQCDMTHS